MRKPFAARKARISVSLSGFLKAECQILLHGFRLRRNRGSDQPVNAFYRRWARWRLPSRFLSGSIVFSCHMLIHLHIHSHTDPVAFCLLSSWSAVLASMAPSDMVASRRPPTHPLPPLPPSLPCAHRPVPSKPHSHQDHTKGLHIHKHHATCV